MIKNAFTTPSALVGYGVGAGVVIGAFVARQHYQKLYSEKADAEIAEIKKHYREVAEEEIYNIKDAAGLLHDTERDSPEEREAYLERLDKLRYNTAFKDDDMVESDDIQPTPGVDLSDLIQTKLDEEHYNHVDVIAADDPRWPVNGEEVDIHRLAEEMARPKDFVPDVKVMAADDSEVDIYTDRDTSVPHIISQVEFFTEGEGQTQVWLKYYSGDSTLLDDRENVITNRNDMIGEYALNMFGIASGDPNLVYVRNLETGIDYEIANHDSDYAEIVAGFIKTNHPKSPLRKMRDE